jgi:hypothetical protein
MKPPRSMGVPSPLICIPEDEHVNGETEQRLYALSAWRETTFFTNRECEALAWTEALILITEGRAPDEVYAEARKEFGEEELVNLSLAIITINGWNRLAIGFLNLKPITESSNAIVVILDLAML